MTNYYIKPSCIDKLKTLISQYNKTIVITDTTVYHLYHDTLDSLNATHIYQLPEGEPSKSFSMTKQVMDKMFALQLDRKSCVVAFGGGVVGDFSGLVASIYLRGIDFIQVPTTLLSMVDSSTGNKNAVDTAYGKNTIGTFYPPRDILIDPNFIKTLPQEQFSNGMAEIIKIAATSNIELWEFINSRPIHQQEETKDDLLEMIRLSVNTKKRIVEGDPTEKGGANKNSREVLNFGHTLGHAIESVTQWNHGKCVALGILLETLITRDGNPVTPYLTRINLLKCLETYQLPIVIPDFSTEQLELIRKFISNDKKSGRLVTVTEIGDWTSLVIKPEDVDQVFEKSRNVSCQGVPEVKSRLDISLPGSKSITNRALLLAAVADGVTQVENILISDDTVHMIHALRQLGVILKQINSSTILITGTNGVFTPKHKTTSLYLGNSGTCVRFLTAMVSACLSPDYQVVITGNNHMLKRPIGDLTDTLITQGVKLEFLTEKNYLPIMITSSETSWSGEQLEVAGDKSSQYISALLMVSPLLGKSTTVKILDNPVSSGFINLTLLVMEEFGAQVDISVEGGYIRYNISSSGYHQETGIYQVEADATAAIYPLILSCVTGKHIVLTNLTSNNTQPDNSLILKTLDLLNIEVDQDKKQTRLNPMDIFKNRLIEGDTINLDLNSSDIFMTVVVFICCWFYHNKLSKKTFNITNIANQNIKECKRISAICQEIKKLGFKLETQGTGLEITGYDMDYYNYGDTISLDSYSDHRMAMSLAILSSVIQEINILDWLCVTKTYPQFWEMTGQFGITTKVPSIKPNYWDRIYSKPIVLIGFPGAGKTTLGKKIAKHLKYHHYDTDIELGKIYKKIDTSLKNDVMEYRHQETEILISLLKRVDADSVISTGGGIIDSIRVREILKTLPFVIYIEKDFRNVLPRVTQVSKLIKTTPENLWQRRLPYYQELATHIFSIPYYKPEQENDNHYWKQLNMRWLHWIEGLRHKFIPRLQSHFGCFTSSELSLDDLTIIKDQHQVHCLQAIEFRADLFHSHEPEAIKAAIVKLQTVINKDIIFTYRTIKEGGQGDPSLARTLANIAIKQGCRILDIELSSDQQITNRQHVYTIGSCHLTNLDDIIKVLSVKWASHQPDQLKLVISRENYQKLQKLNVPVLTEKHNSIILQDHKTSRYLNHYLTPVKFQMLTGTAPLQISLDSSYRIKKELFHLSDNINKYYLFGNPIAGSVGDQYHNQWFSESSSLSEYHKYQTDQITEAVDILRQKHTQGASVTIPLKTDILPYLDKISKYALQIGAVNTVTRLSNGDLIGENTDWLAMRDLIKLNLNNLQEFCGLVVGTGGVARAACHTFQELGVPYYIWGRNRETAETLKVKHEAQGVFYTETGKINEIIGETQRNRVITIICVPPEVLIDIEDLPCELVLEQGYTKPKRKYPVGCIFISGLDILVTQAKYQNKIWMANNITGIIN